MAAPKKKKKLLTVLKLQIMAGKANPSPPIGPVLGQHQVNIMEFCKQFNARTQGPDKEGLIIPVVINVYEDKSFDFSLKVPPVSVLIKKTLGIEKGAKAPRRDEPIKITRKQVMEIAKQKMPDLNCTSLEAAMRQVEGTARNMGIDVAGD